MHTASSAKRTWSELRSASEKTATVEIPSSLHASMTRKAISPRLAMRIFRNILGHGPRPETAYLRRDGRRPNSGSPYSTGWPFSTKSRVTSPATSASISFISFIASMMQTVLPAST